MTRKSPIPFEVYHRPAGTNGGEGWVITIHPAALDGGMPCNFGAFEKAAVFIAGLNRGVVDQSAFQ
jgi:hypothetical protein